MAKGDIRDVWETNRKRLERKRETEREYARANRDRKAAEFEANKVKSAYHADWKGTTYQCPELKYRGLA